jgi:hypothetical protein
MSFESRVLVEKKTRDPRLQTRAHIGRDRRGLLAGRNRANSPD